MTINNSNTMRTDLVVIGGGITGLGIARDAAMRGFKVILVERDELGSGTSGYFHGILHSGARYAVVDPESAKECYHENQILRKIVPQAILDRGSFFLALDDEEIKFADTLLSACQSCGIPTKEVSSREVLKNEPRITREVKRAFSVPAGHIDGLRTLNLNKKAAESLGAQIFTNSEVTGFVKKNGRIEAVLVHTESGAEIRIVAKTVINAAGIWASRVAKFADIIIPLVADKGSMIVFKERFSHAYLQRCRMPTDVDLFLPTWNEYIIGTTSVKTDNIDTHEVKQWEIDKLIGEGERLIPGLSTVKIDRVYAGVRPLYSPSSKQIHGRQDSRSFKVINHRENGIDNFISVVGGKFLIYRLMAEKAVDAMCDNLGVNKVCETANVPMSSS